MKKLEIVFENEPSPQAVKNAWWVIAKSITRRTGITVEPIFKDEVKK